MTAPRTPNDKLDPEEFPAGYDVPALERRRDRWTARLFAVIACAGLMANIALSMTLFALMPLKQTEPFLVELQDKNDVVATITPISTTVPGFSLLTEELARNYVVLRNEIVRNDDEMLRRWGPGGPLRLMESDAETERFAAVMKTTYQALRQAGITREVHILTANRLPDRRAGYYNYLVAFQVVERDVSEAVVRRATFNATLEVTYQPKRVAGGDSLVNPTGFTVTSYSVAEAASITPPAPQQAKP